MRKVLLDTNAYSDYIKGERRILDIIGTADRVNMSIFVIAELLYGFKLGVKRSENEEKLDCFLNKSTVRIVPATLETADIFSELKKQLKKKATPVPTNDLWIAAHAVETGSVIVSSDRHFTMIDGLRIT